MPTAPHMPVTIRSFQAADQASCAALYREGLIGGKIADNDTGYDLHDIDAAYMKCPGSHFWVAENEAHEVVAMIGVQHHDADTGEIRRLRVHPDYRRRGIGTTLIETALEFCQRRNYLKVTLDTFMEHSAAIRLFEKFHFRLDRTRTLGGRDLLYFYLDLYKGEDRREAQ